MEQGLKQGDNSASLIFNLVLVFILRQLRIYLKGTIEYKSTQFLDYAGDTVVTSRS
jgi:hypothetical protein